MSLNGMIKRNCYWCKDILMNRGLVKKQYDEIISILYNPVLGRKKVEQYIEKLIEHAADTTIFYKDYKGKTLSEVSVINKDICNSRYTDFISDKYDYSRLHKMSTNGSTGRPFTIGQNYEKRCRVIAELKVYMYLCGLKSHEPLIFFDALSAKGKKTSFWYGLKENIWKYDVYNFSKDNIDNMVKFINKHPADTLLAYPSAMQCIAQMLDGSDRLHNSKIDTVVTAGEMLSDNVRNQTKKMFGEKCKVLSRYSNQEMGILAQEMNEKEGFLPNYGSYYFEILKLEEDKPAEVGELGRIVITDLFNYAFPLIRYDTGDVGMWSEYEDETNWGYIREVYGKRNDLLYDNNENPIIPEALDDMFFGIDSVEQWQIVQNSIGEFVIRLKLKRVDNKELEIIESKMKKISGKESKVDIEIVESISARPGGKQQFIICNLHKK